MVPPRDESGDYSTRPDRPATVPPAGLGDDSERHSRKRDLASFGRPPAESAIASRPAPAGPARRAGTDLARSVAASGAAKGVDRLDVRRSGPEPGVALAQALRPGGRSAR